MKILIAGGNGEVGEDLAGYLSKQHEVIVGSRKCQNKKIGNIIHKKIDFSKKIVFNKKIDLIVNCLATHEHSKRKEFDDYYKSNVLSIFNIIRFAKKKKIRVINLSTVSIYDTSKNQYVSEINEEISNNKLAVTKFIGEKLFKLSDIDFISLRMPGVLTTNKKATRPWLRLQISNFRHNKKITCFNLEKNFNSMIDTKEIFYFINFAIKKKFPNDNYNFLANRPIKLKNIFQIIKKKLNSKSNIVNLKNTKSIIIDMNKVKKKYHFKINSVKNILTRNLND